MEKNILIYISILIIFFIAGIFIGRETLHGDLEKSGNLTAQLSEENIRLSTIIKRESEANRDLQKRVDDFISEVRKITERNKQLENDYKEFIDGTRETTRSIFSDIEDAIRLNRELQKQIYE